jgi:5-dehydro-4-deoxyglucarate dehydratase
VGGVGELYSLSVTESIEVVRRTVRAVRGRMPVFAGVGYGYPLAVEMARGMEQAGADILLVLPPYYSNPPMEGLIRYYQEIGNACGIPLGLYSREWASFTAEEVAVLAERVPSLHFWKDGQGDTRKLHRIMQVVGDRLAWLGGIGDDCAPGYFAVGVQAYSSGIANFAPRLSVAIGEAGLNGDFARLRALTAEYVLPFYKLRDRARGHEVATMKEAMRQLGKPAGPVRPPLTELQPPEVEEIRLVLELLREWI